ncbi:hypothetical protein HK104_009122 [Borealophlyctis nickersoniae]|nr:hypothetical protein HK104_009122 [Borealophlyctis nickersoniae]
MQGVPENNGDQSKPASVRRKASCGSSIISLRYGRPPSVSADTASVKSSSRTLTLSGTGGASLDKIDTSQWDVNRPLRQPKKPLWSKKAPDADQPAIFGPDSPLRKIQHKLPKEVMDIFMGKHDDADNMTVSESILHPLDLDDPMCLEALAALRYYNEQEIRNMRLRKVIEWYKKDIRRMDEQIEIGKMRVFSETGEMPTDEELIRLAGDSDEDE